MTILYTLSPTYRTPDWAFATGWAFCHISPDYIECKPSVEACVAVSIAYAALRVRTWDCWYCTLILMLDCSTLMYVLSVVLA